MDAGDAHLDAGYVTSEHLSGASYYPEGVNAHLDVRGIPYGQ